jgi:acyl-CoA hydrolase
MPGEANNLGTAFGGMVTAWTDAAAAIAACATPAARW